MDFTRTKRRTILHDGGESSAAFLNHNLQFYTDIPTDKVNLLDLIGLGIERQKGNKSQFKKFYRY